MKSSICNENKRSYLRYKWGIENTICIRIIIIYRGYTWINKAYCKKHDDGRAIFVCRSHFVWRALWWAYKISFFERKIGKWIRIIRKNIRKIARIVYGFYEIKKIFKWRKVNHTELYF